MPENISKISIKNAAGSGYDTREIGAKGQNIRIGYDAQGQVVLDVNATTPIATKSLSKTIQDIENDVKGKAADNHAWSDANIDHGKASSSQYGHIKLGKGLSVNQDGGSADFGATEVAFANDNEKVDNKAVKANDSRLENDRKNPHKLIFARHGSVHEAIEYDGSKDTTVGIDELDALHKSHEDVVASATTLGHVKVLDGSGLDIGSDGYLMVDFGNRGDQACIGNDARLSDKRVPLAHASNSPIYGKGSGSEYGHVKLSDLMDAGTGGFDSSFAVYGESGDGSAASTLAVLRLCEKIWYSNPNLFVEFKDITADFKSGLFSRNISRYKPGNYFKIPTNTPNSSDSFYTIVLMDYNYYKTDNTPYKQSIKENHWVAMIMADRVKKVFDFDTHRAGFLNSDLSIYLKEKYEPAFIGALGSDHICKHEIQIMIDDYPGYEWDSDCKLTLMSERQVIGSDTFISANSVGRSGDRQFSIFRYCNPVEVFTKNYGQSFLSTNTGDKAWLMAFQRDNAGKMASTIMIHSGQISYTSSNIYNHLIYPVFCLK
nr:MAG TPA: hypothetical protein [Caudoviricetes sp.]